MDTGLDTYSTKYFYCSYTVYIKYILQVTLASFNLSILTLVGHYCTPPFNSSVSVLLSEPAVWLIQGDPPGDPAAASGAWTGLSADPRESPAEPHTADWTAAAQVLYHHYAPNPTLPTPHHTTQEHLNPSDRGQNDIYYSNQVVKALQGWCIYVGWTHSSRRNNVFLIQGGVFELAAWTFIMLAGRWDPWVRFLEETHPVRTCYSTCCPQWLLVCLVCSE